MTSPRTSVDFHTVSTAGLESSPHAEALAGLRANEARYFKNKYDHEFVLEPAGDAADTIEWVHRILEEERDIVIASPALEATSFEVEGTRWAYVFYESGLSINVLYGPEKRAVGFKLSDGMDVPAELESRFKFARQKSKLAGTIRGSFFVVKGEDWPGRAGRPGSRARGDEHRRRRASRGPPAPRGRAAGEWLKHEPAEQRPAGDPEVAGRVDP